MSVVEFPSNEKMIREQFLEALKDVPNLEAAVVVSLTKEGALAVRICSATPPELSFMKDFFTAFVLSHIIDNNPTDKGPNAG